MLRMYLHTGKSIELKRKRGPHVDPQHSNTALKPWHQMLKNGWLIWLVNGTNPKQL